jgi:hypothetical protein
MGDQDDQKGKAQLDCGAAPLARAPPPLGGEAAVAADPFDGPPGAYLTGAAVIFRHSAPAGSKVVLVGCYQDGPDFYSETPDDNDIVAFRGAIASYPDLVHGDDDMEGAEAARIMFAIDHPEFVTFSGEAS